MTPEYPIFGFRQDRIGARLICLLNVLRLQEKFDVAGTYLWLSQPDGPYPELADPLDFLSPQTVAQHVRVVSEVPDKGGAENLRSIAPGIGSADFARRLAQGRRFECDSMSEIIQFMDEKADAVAQPVRRIAAGLQLSAQLQDALAHARERIARVGGGKPIAIHVRRGDILDSDPWSYSCWPSKYVPDEFYRAFLQGAPGPVIAFSDTPAAVAHLAQGNARVVPVAGLFDDPSLSVAQRDLLELLLMGECGKVGAPSQSAFSQAAAIVGGARIVGLPHMLPADLKLAANDALLDRVIGDQDSFYAPGDLAQCTHYAAMHAIGAGRGAELVDALAGRGDFIARFPFLYRELAVVALGAGQKAKARKLARQGLKSPLIRNRDKPQCRQVLLVLGDDNTPTAAPEDVDARFLGMCFSGRSADGLIVPALAHRLLTQDSRAAQALMFSPHLADAYAETALEVLTGGDDTGQGAVLPLWVLRSDWFELVSDLSLRRDMMQRPALPHKTAPAADLLTTVEAALKTGATPPDPDDHGHALLGFFAAQFRLHGRLQRGFNLLHWLDDIHPGDALTHKRLADSCFAAGNRKAGKRWLDSALALAPENALLHISAAARALEVEDMPTARDSLTRAEAIWPELELIDRIRRRAKKAG